MKRYAFTFVAILALPALAQIHPTGVDDTNPPLVPPTPPTNTCPVWLDTPVVNFTEGMAGSILMTPDFLFDPEDDIDNGNTIILIDGGGCTLPTDTSVNDTLDSVDAGTGTTAVIRTSCSLSADDGTCAPVVSPLFTITIAASGGGATATRCGTDA